MKLTAGIHMTPQLSLRWLTIACFEVRVGDFSIVIDPCVGASPPRILAPRSLSGPT